MQVPLRGCIDCKTVLLVIIVLFVIHFSFLRNIENIKLCVKGFSRNVGHTSVCSDYLVYKWGIVPWNGINVLSILNFLSNVSFLSFVSNLSERGRSYEFKYEIRDWFVG